MQTKHGNSGRTFQIVSGETATKLSEVARREAELADCQKDERQISMLTTHFAPAVDVRKPDGQLE